MQAKGKAASPRTNQVPPRHFSATGLLHPTQHTVNVNKIKWHSLIIHNSIKSNKIVSQTKMKYLKVSHQLW